MSELHDVYEPGDTVITTDYRGGIYVWFVNDDGWLTLRQSPVLKPKMHTIPADRREP